MATTTELASNTTDNAPPKIIKIVSNDGQMYEIDENVIEQSSTIKTLSDSMFYMFINFILILLFYLALFVGDTPIPLPNIHSSILAPVSHHFISFLPINSGFLRLLNIVIIIKMIPNQKRSMKMMMKTRIRICTNPKGIDFFFFQ
jgi:hypothetical protein